MAITKHMLVSFKHPETGRKTVGFIESRTASAMKLAFEEDGALCCYTSPRGLQDGPERLVKMLQIVPLEKGATVPDQVQGLLDTATALPARKGDIVAFEYEGKRHTGRVLKGGRRAVVTLDEHSTLSLPSAELSPAELPASDEGLEDWAVLSYTVVPGHDDSEPFRAVIGFKGKPVIEAQNDGWGGPNGYDSAKNGTRVDLQALGNAITAFCKAHGDIYSEDTDRWLHWDWYIRPTGLSFADYLEDMLSFKTR